jgi:hypothetical protein
MGSRHGRADLSADRDCVRADICVIGTVSHAQKAFRWAWADDGIAPPARHGLDLVRAFGETHDLPQLTTPEWSGGRAEGLEMLAIAGRIQNAREGSWMRRRT